MPFPFRKERGLKHWRVLDCSGLRKVESVFQQHGNTQRNQQVDGFLCRGAHLGTTERRSPVLCYSFVYISGHALCLMLCFSPTFLFSVTGCSVRSAIAAEILKKLQCRNLLNGKPLDKKTPQRLQLFGPAGWQISYSNLIKMKQIEYFAFFFPFCVSTCIAAYPDCITSVQIIFYIGSASRIYTVEMHKAITCCPTQHQAVVNLLLNAYCCSWDTTWVSA